MAEYEFEDGDLIYVSLRSQQLAKERGPLKTLHESNTPTRKLIMKKRKSKSKRKKSLQPVKSEKELEAEKVAESSCAQ